MLDTSKLEPMHDWILIKLLDRGKTPGGLFIPDIADDENRLAEVISVGPGLLNEAGQRLPMGVKKGDIVLVPRLKVYRVDGDILTLQETNLVLRYNVAVN